MTSRLFLSAVLALSLGASCKKKQGDAPAEDAPTQPTAKDATPSVDDAPSADATPSADDAPSADATPSADDAPSADADYIKVLATHAKPKPSDPVVVQFPTFKVVTEGLDPQNLETAQATIEIDITSLSSGIPDRDKHLASADYLDSTKMPTATVRVSKVKKTGEKAYTASATVNLHGVEATMPVTFEVVSATADSVRVKATHAFKRSDFQVGKAEGDSAAEELSAEVLLTLKKS